MKKMRVPEGAIRAKLQVEGLDPDQIDYSCRYQPVPNLNCSCGRCTPVQLLQLRIVLMSLLPSTPRSNTKAAPANIADGGQMHTNVVVVVVVLRKLLIT